MNSSKQKSGTSLLVILFMSVLLLAPFSPLLNTGHTKEPLSRIERNIKKKKLKEKSIQKDIIEKKEKVKEAIKKERSVLENIGLIEDKIKQKKNELSKLNRRISKTRSEILLLSKEIHAISEKLISRERDLGAHLKKLYKEQYRDNILILISASDNQDLIRKSKYLGLLSFRDTRMIKGFRDEIHEVEQKKKSMEELQAKLEQNTSDAKKKKKELETERTRKDKLLSTIRSKRENYEQTIKELEQSSKNLQKMIKELEKKKVPVAVSGKGFRASKGQLPWPVSGKLIVPFGKYKDPKFNITVFKNGIEIKADPNDRPRAIAGGNIVYADWFKGYGLLLIINHGGGYHTLYGNLAEIFNKPGDIINKGTVIGKVGKSRILNIPSLYFEVRYKGKPLNPVIWLKKRSVRPKRKYK